MDNMAFSQIKNCFTKEAVKRIKIKPQTRRKSLQIINLMKDIELSQLNNKKTNNSVKHGKRFAQTLHQIRYTAGK